MNAWFSQLNQREQMSVFGLAVVVVLYVLYVAVWSPLSSRREELLLQNAAVADSLTRMDAMVSEYLLLKRSGANTNNRRNLTSVVNQSTRRLDLPVSRLQPNSRGDIQVRLENAAFDDMMAWLYDMEFREGLLVREVSITRAGAVGRVNATIRIAQAG